MLNLSQKKELEEVFAARVTFDCLLRQYTTFRIGGPAAAFVHVDNRAELSFLLRFCQKEQLRSFCLGRGSNLLVVDEGFPGVAFRLGKEFAEIAVLLDTEAEKDSSKAVSVRAGGGISLAKFSGVCCRHGFSGMEFSGGIPGSLGGAVIMNAGAWGEDMAGVVRRVELIDAEKSWFVSGEQLDFTYRNWPWFAKKFKQGEVVIAAAEVELEKDSPDSIGVKCRRLASKRKEKQKISRPNAGSFFKNPSGKSAGRLIESCGMKGFRIGDAMVSEEHANFFVNMGEAKASEVIELMQVVQKNVEMKSGVILDPEVRIIK